MKRIRQSVVLVILLASLIIGQAPVLAAPVGTIVNSPSAVSSLPISGFPVPELTVFDETMQKFMDERSVKAGALVVMKDGVIVLEHGYGWMDKALQVPIQPSAMFRMASIIKPVTKVAILKLIKEGKINASDKAFCLAGSPSSCQLTITPFGTPDARLIDITIQNLLDHKGGWDRAISGDPMFKPTEIAAALGVSALPSKQDTVRYMMGQPLDHTPGTVYAYSNFGYLLLGLVVEKITGQTYTAYIQNQIFNPLGIANTDIELGRSLPQYRNPREPWYSDPTTVSSVFDANQQVPYPDGGFYLEAMDAHGGMIATTRAMANFIQAYWIGSGDPRTGNGQQWTFFGSLPGTTTIIYQRADGVNLVAYFNQRADPSGLAYDQSIKSMLDTATDSVTVWPTPTTFADVPASHPQYKYIQALYDAGLTSGCSTNPLKFCPDNILDRAQSSVFMVRGQLGATFTPPPAPWTTFLLDNWTGYEYAQAWAEAMYKAGLTTGCQQTPLMYCPEQKLSRVQASILGLRMKNGVAYVPPAGTGTVFADYPATDPSYSWGIAWAEQAYADGLFPACGTDPVSNKPTFCPNELVNRGWAAYLIVKAKNIAVP